MAFGIYGACLRKAELLLSLQLLHIGYVGEDIILPRPASNVQ